MTSRLAPEREDVATAEENPFTDILRATPKHVATRNPGADLPYPHSHPLVGEAIATVATLKSEGDGDLVVLGSLELVHQLAAAGLVDRFPAQRRSPPSVAGRDR